MLQRLFLYYTFLVSRIKFPHSWLKKNIGYLNLAFSIYTRMYTNSQKSVITLLFTYLIIIGRKISFHDNLK